MYSIHLVHVLTFSTVLCDIQRFQDGTFIADFIVINKGRMLYPSIVMFIEDLTLNECTKYCIKHLDCVTFNYHLRTRACELVDQNFDEFEALDDDPNWCNYGTPEKIDGGWSNWFEGSTCSSTCGYGFQTHYRTCTAPEPKYGGVPCIGNRVQTVSCKIVSCPIDGLSDWINDGQCSVTCGGGILNQIKTCTNPAPQHGGQQCTEQPKRTIACNEQKCPIDGGLSDWVNDGKCSVTCGGGTLNQIKTCTNPAPQHGGQQCTEQPRRTTACTEQKCPRTCIKHVHNGGCCKFPITHHGTFYKKCWLNHDKEYFCIGVDNGYHRCVKQTDE